MREAATIVHDAHIGIGQGVFHLFRMPETFEIEMHRLLGNQDTQNAVQTIIKNKDSAEQFLCNYGQDSGDHAVGPFRVDDTTKILTPQIWGKVAGQYSSAFNNGKKTFPYFTTS